MNRLSCIMCLIVIFALSAVGQEQRTRDQEDQMVQSLIDETFKRFKEVVKTGREHAAHLNDGKASTSP